MSPARIARAEEPAGATDAPRRGLAMRAQSDALSRRRRAEDEQSITIARHFGGAQQELVRLIAEGYSAAEIERARELVERLRREQSELVGVRAWLAAKAKQLRAALIPVEAEETLTAATELAIRVDAAVRVAGRELRTLVPQLLRAVSEQQVAERQLSALHDQRREVTAFIDAVPAAEELVRAAQAVIAYATSTTAPTIERNRPVDAANAEAPSPPSPEAAA